MAENKKPRTNWSDKARRITGAVTLLVIVLAIILAVSLSKGKAKKSEVTSVVTAPVTVTETKVEVKEEKTPEPVAEVKVEEPVVVPAAPEPVVVEAAVEEPVVEEKAEVVAVPETASFSVFGINVDNQWYNGSFTASVREKGVVTTAEMLGFLRYEIDKYGQEINALISGVKFAQDSVSFRYVSSIDPEGLLPVLKRDIEEYILKFFVPKSVEKVETPVVAEEVAVVEEPAPEPVVEEKKAETATFSVFGYNVENSWMDGKFTSLTEKKGLVSEDDVRGFVLYEIAKYGDLLLANTSVEFVADGFVLTYPEEYANPSDYLATYKADLEEYILTLFAPVEEKKAETASFSVFGYNVDNSWMDGKFTSLTEMKGLVSEDDVRGFVLYEIAKYGDFLLANTAVEFVADGFVLTYPEEYANPSDYLATYKADLEEYILTLFAPLEEKKAETATFSVFGYGVENSWMDGKFTSLTEMKGLVSEDDVRGFVLYEIAKYGDFLLANTAVEFVADGFVLTYPEEYAAPSDYLATYKADLEEYILTLFAPVEEPAPEPVVEEKKAETASFSVFGYTVNNSWMDGKFTSLVEKKGVVSEDDVRGFVLYEIAKYGDFLLANTSVEFVADGFVLTYPAEYADPSDYLATYKADLEEYVTALFAPSSEPVQEEAPVEVVVEEPAPVETPVVAEEPAPAEPKIPSAVEDIMVSVVTDKVQEVVEGADVKSASAAKIASFDVSASLGLDFGVKSGRSYNPTIFPRLALSAEFRNMFSIGSIGVGVRMDGAINFLPLDGTFVGHDMAYFTKTTNWGMDATLDWKVMFSKDFGSTSLYLGAGVGYSLASNLPSITSHSGAMSFGFKTSVVATGVVGVQWMLSDTFFLSLEGQGRYFIQSGEYAFGSSMRMGWRF